MNQDLKDALRFDGISRDFGGFCNFNSLTLDVGCGTRKKAPYMIKGVYFGIDPLKGEKKGFHFSIAVGEELPFKDGIFDCCTIATTLDHVNNPDLVLSEVKRVLKDKGKLGLWNGVTEKFVFFRKLLMLKLKAVFDTTFNRDKQHNYRFSVRDLINLVKKHGFSIKKMELKHHVGASLFIVGVKE